MTLKASVFAACAYAAGAFVMAMTTWPSDVRAQDKVQNRAQEKFLSRTITIVVPYPAGDRMTTLRERWESA
ncbi:MAG: hypothetical protein ABI790_01475 [Betaproteobacteria bacterium]